MRREEISHIERTRTSRGTKGTRIFRKGLRERWDWFWSASRTRLINTLIESKTGGNKKAWTASSGLLCGPTGTMAIIPRPSPFRSLVPQPFSCENLKKYLKQLKE